MGVFLKIGIIFFHQIQFLYEMGLTTWRLPLTDWAPLLFLARPPKTPVQHKNSEACSHVCEELLAWSQIGLEVDIALLWKGEASLRRLCEDIGTSKGKRICL